MTTQDDRPALPFADRSFDWWSAVILSSPGGRRSPASSARAARFSPSRSGRAASRELSEFMLGPRRTVGTRPFDGLGRPPRPRVSSSEICATNGSGPSSSTSAPSSTSSVWSSGSSRASPWTASRIGWRPCTGGYEREGSFTAHATRFLIDAGQAPVMRGRRWRRCGGYAGAAVTRPPPPLPDLPTPVVANGLRPSAPRRSGTGPHRRCGTSTWPRWRCAPGVLSGGTRLLEGDADAGRDRLLVPVPSPACAPPASISSASATRPGGIADPLGQDEEPRRRPHG